MTIEKTTERKVQIPEDVAVEEQRERACRERHDAIKYHRWDHNANYEGYRRI